MHPDTFIIRVVPSLLTVIMAGCATVPREAGFSDVEKTVASRTGMRVHWNQGTASDEAVAAIVQSMLREELSADRAVQVALLNNRTLQATYADLGVAQAELVEAGLLGNPVFDAEIRFAEGGGGTGLEMSVVQNFIDVFFIPLRKRIAGSAFEAAKLEVAGAAIDLAGRVRAAYYRLQAAEQLLEMRQAVFAAAEASHEMAKRLREAGNITARTLAIERIQYEQAKLDSVEAEIQIVELREELNVLMGLWGEQTDWKVARRLPEMPQEELATDGVVARAVERNLELASARERMAATAQRLGFARSFGLIPEAELGASAEREPGGEWAVGPAFSLPIPLFNQGQPGVAIAAAELQRSRDLYAATAIEIRAEARAAVAGLRHARRRTDYYRKVILPLRQQVLDQTQLEFNAMQIGVFELLLARQQQVQAGADYIEALRDYWLARTVVVQLTSGRRAPFSRGGSSTAARPDRNETQGNH